MLKMELPNDCPDCGKQLSKTRKHCTCGWKIAKFIEKNEIDRSCCQYQTPTGPCQELGTITPAGMGEKRFCRKHWYMATQEKSKY